MSGRERSALKGETVGNTSQRDTKVRRNKFLIAPGLVHINTIHQKWRPWFEGRVEASGADNDINLLLLAIRVYKTILCDSFKALCECCCFGTEKGLSIAVTWRRSPTAHEKSVGIIFSCISGRDC